MYAEAILNAGEAADTTARGHTDRSDHTPKRAYGSKCFIENFTKRDQRVFGFH